MKYSIVIPTFNENGNIVQLIKDIENCGLRDFEIIVIDENSPDGTCAAVNEYAAGKPHIRGICNDGIKGLSPCIVKGFNLAAGEYICCMDGDLQHSANDLGKVINTLDSADFVIGSRYADNGGFAEKWSLFRVIASRSAAWMARFFLKVKASDPMSGFFAVRRDVFHEIQPKLNPTGFKIMLEILFHLSQSGKSYRITEKGITFNLRRSGSSKLNSTVIIQYLKMLRRLRKQRVR